MVVIDELIAILGYKVEGTEEVKKFQDGLDGVEQSAQKSSGSIRKIGLAAGAAAGAAAGLTYKAVTDFAAFERELSRIGITAGASAVETAAASDVVQRLAKDFALPIDQAVAGLDTLVSSGMSLEQAMSFLPSVLATAQASGAATQDIANTAIKASSALKLQASDMQAAFDVMVAGGKAGQFELKAMAAYIPELANSFASLGYSGQDGLKRLIALLQTLMEDTGSAGSAAVQAQNVFGKILAPQTITAFDKFGIDLPARLKEATSKGEDIIEAFVRVSREALGGDMSLLPQLFTDQEFRLGMQSLISSEESFKAFLAAVNGAEVDGSVFRDLNRILGGTQAQIDRLTTSWDRFMNSLGSAAAGPVGGGLDFLSNDLDFGEAVRKKLEAEGMSYWEREGWIFKNTFNRDEMARKAREGGYVPAGDDQARIDAKETPYAYEVLGRRPNRPVSPTPAPSSAISAASPTVAPQPPAIDQSWFDRLTSSLSTMLGGQGASEAVVNDNRQDNRQFPVSVQAPVTVNVQQATQAPAAVGSAVSGAVQQGVQAVPSRMQSGLSPQ